jgi:hypothetical protein
LTFVFGICAAFGVGALCSIVTRGREIPRLAAPGTPPTGRATAGTTPADATLCGSPGLTGKVDAPSPAVASNGVGGAAVERPVEPCWSCAIAAGDTGDTAGPPSPTRTPTTVASATNTADMVFLIRLAAVPDR